MNKFASYFDSQERARAVERAARRHERRTLEAMQIGQTAGFGFNDEIRVTCTERGFEVNGQAMTTGEALTYLAEHYDELY